MSAMMSENPVKTQLSKTVSCTFYAKGNCTKGAGCRYAHSDDELRTVPDLTKTSLCKDWKVGSCRLGALKCAYAHGVKELKSTPYFLSRSRDLQKRSRLQSRDSTDEATQDSSKQSVQPQEPPPAAASMAKFMEDRSMENDSDSGDSVKTQGSTFVGIAVFAPSALIHPALTAVSNEANISLVQLSYALQLGAVSPMNEDHALAQRLVEAMPQFYED